MERLGYCQHVVNKFQGRTVCVCKCLHVMVCMRSPVGVMSGCIIGYCWVEGHAGLSADGRLIFFYVLSAGGEGHMFDVSLMESGTR